MESKELKKQIFQTAVERVLDAHQVPARQLLLALQRMEGIIADYQSLDSSSKTERSAHAAQLKTLENSIKRLTDLIDTYEKNSSTHTKKIGDLLNVHAGKAKEINDAIAAAKALVPEKGDPGADATIDVGLVISQVTEALRGSLPQDIVSEPKEELDEDAMYQKFVKRIQKERPIDVSHLKNAESFIFGKKKYKIEELMRGSGGTGGASGTSVYGEVVAGSGTAWTLASAPTAGTLRLYANGQRLTVTVDYTQTGTSITTLTGWAVGTLLADYSHT